MFWERLEVCVKHFWKNQLSGNRENIHWNSQQACTYVKEVGKDKSGSLYDECFTQSNYEKIGIRN